MPNNEIENSDTKQGGDPPVAKTPISMTIETPKNESDPDAPEISVSAAESAAESIAITIRTTRYLRMNVSLGILALIALVAALYLARAFFVPLLIGILVSYTLSPIVSWLSKFYIPRALGAAMVMALLIGGFSWIAYTLSDDAAALIDNLPEAAKKLRQNLRAARSEVPSALQNMQEAANELEGVAADVGAKSGARVVPVRTTSPTWLRDYALAQSALLLTIAAQTPVILLITYFLLASGDRKSVV